MGSLLGDVVGTEMIVDSSPKRGTVKTAASKIRATLSQINDRLEFVFIKSTEWQFFKKKVVTFISNAIHLLDESKFVSYG